MLVGRGEFIEYQDSIMTAREKNEELLKSIEIKKRVDSGGLQFLLLYGVNECLNSGKYFVH
jgi:hypothetical protein